jgi:hypothetical protein
MITFDTSAEHGSGTDRAPVDYRAFGNDFFTLLFSECLRTKFEELIKTGLLGNMYKHGHRHEHKHEHNLSTEKRRFHYGASDDFCESDDFVRDICRARLEHGKATILFEKSAEHGSSTD